MLQIKQSILSVAHQSASDAGTKSRNQDAHAAHMPIGSALALRGAVFCVADGISSSSQSGAAAEMAVNTLIKDYYETPEAWTAATAAKSVISAMNARLFAQNRALDDLNKGLVCTLSAVVLHGRQAHVFHVGDSRIQRWRAGGFEVLTRDHRVTTDEGGSYLARALGLSDRLTIDHQICDLQVGDFFLLSTDGLHDFIRPTDVTAALTDTPFTQAPTTLIKQALANGSDDNLTVLMAKVQRLPSEQGAEISLYAKELSPPTDLRAGDVLDGYQIIRPLHQTARSQVFLARSKAGHDVILKVPASDIMGDSDAVQRFMLENWIMGQVSSPYIIADADHKPKPTALYVTAAYFNGQTLRTWMQDQQQVDLTAIRDIAEQLVQGLIALHRQEILHQDLRPENIMINSAGEVKIIDLGSAAVAGIDAAVPGLLGLMPGTYQYTAPEYLSGGHVSWRSDQYALGVIIYEMLTGDLPYGQRSAQVRSVQDQMRLNYRSARGATISTPVWMDQAIEKAVHPDPLRRYDALSEFLSDIRRPRPGWTQQKFIPLAERNPLRFWQGVSLILAVLCFVLLITPFT